MSTIQARAAGLPTNLKRKCFCLFFFFFAFPLFRPRKPSFFDAKKAKSEFESGPYPRKVPAQTRKTAHEHETAADFSVTPLCAGAAWRGALETAV